MTIKLQYWPKRNQFVVDRVYDWNVFTQFRDEAGIRAGVNNENFDSFLRVASSHGYFVETIEMDKP